MFVHSSSLLCLSFHLPQIPFTPLISCLPHSALSFLLHVILSPLLLLPWRPFSSPPSVLGRSIVIHSHIDGSYLTCANIDPEILSETVVETSFPMNNNDPSDVFFRCVCVCVCVCAYIRTYLSACEGWCPRCQPDHQSCCLLLAHPLNGGYMARSGCGYYKYQCVCVCACVHVCVCLLWVWV